jgi:transcriptional regulator with XRE-family HTH domain
LTGPMGAPKPRRREPKAPGAFKEWLEANPIRVGRLKEGLAQRTLAGMVGLSDVSIRQLEQGVWHTSETFPRLEVVLKLPTGRLTRTFARWLRRRPDLVAARQRKGKSNGME